MAGFEKTMLATGEARGEYIQRRLQEKATVKEIATEINDPQMYTGPEGKKWPESIIYTEKRKLDQAAKKGAGATEKDPGFVEVAAPETLPEVPAEYEGVLDSTDMAEIRAEAAASLKKKQRATARKEALAKATQDLEREARLAELRGEAKGDLVDITIDLAPYAPDIRINGKSYQHGSTHRVPRKVYAVLAEQMQRSWNHQEGLQGKNENAYRRTFAQRRQNGNPSAGVAGPVNGVVA